MTVADLVIQLLELPLDSKVRFASIKTNSPLPKNSVIYICDNKEWKEINLEEKYEQRTFSS